MVDSTTECGGCKGFGAHVKRCPRRPGFDYMTDVLAEDAEDLGDRIGGSDPAAANMAYALASRLRDARSRGPETSLSHAVKDCEAPLGCANCVTPIRGGDDRG